MDQKHKHFYNRATFGRPPETTKATVSGDVGRMIKESGQKMIQVVTNPVDDFRAKMEKGDENKRKAYREQLKKFHVQLNTRWISQMEDPSVALREKMVFFWHDHFACRTRNPYLAQQQNNTIRQYALGNFGDLLMAVSKDAAMLQFLNNQQNKKDSPNENFAREVMELFTLGRGHYTEEDIRNAASAFTGWGFNPLSGAFVFRKKLHDEGVKSFRGKSGNFSGEDIISMILEDKDTARFITQKVWQFFVHPEKTDKDVVNDLSQEFYSSGYDITGLMKNIFTAGWFYSEKYVGNRIKSPVELIVGWTVHTGGTFNNPANLLFLQKALGQVLFQPPNVGGWPVDKEWIDSSSLALRMSLPSVLLKDAATEFEAKDDGDVNNVTNEFDKARKISFAVDWKKLSDIFVKNTAAETTEAIAYHLLAKPTSDTNRKIIDNMTGKTKDDPEFIKKAFIAFMSLPDYQLS